MFKDRAFISVCLSIPLLLLASLLRPKPATVMPLYYNPVQQNGAVSERFWVLKAQGMTRFDMILMGDSRVYRGLSPQAMETVLPGLRILNYGWSSGGLNPEMYAAAESRLDPRSHQKSIVLGITPLTLTPRTEKNEHFLQEVQRPPDYVFMHLYGMPLLQLFEPVNLNDISRLFLGDSTPQTQAGYHLEFYDDGWVASWTVPEDPRAQMASYRDIFSQTQVSPRLVQVLMDQTRRWRAQGIRVYAFHVPTTQAMRDLENQISGFDEAAFVQQFEAAGGVWFSIPLEPYHSYDSTHIDKPSAIQLSIDLANLIKDWLAANPH
jgi:hypothetical protein